MIEHRLPLFLVGWAFAAALLGALYLWQRRTRDATAVDAGWAGAAASPAVEHGAGAGACLQVAAPLLQESSKQARE